MDIRKEYFLINWIMNSPESKSLGLTREQKLKFTKYSKEQIRKYMKPLNTDPFAETYHYRDEYGESYYTKEFFKYPFTEEEKEEFIEDQWRRINSPWDCTGMVFTTSIRICNFKEPNSFGAMSCVYHFLSRDV